MIADRLAALFERRFHPSQDPPSWITAGWETASGAAVTPETALAYSAVFGCVRILAETIASLPLPVYQRLAGGGKDRAPDHYLYPILHDSPNPEMTSVEFRETLQGHLALRGNAFAEIEFNGRGEVAALWPLRPDRMRLERVNGALKYVYQLPERLGAPEQVLPASRVLHLRAFGPNGLTGHHLVYLARQSIGLGLATEEFGSRFFGNGARPGGVLRHPGKLSPESHKRMGASWDEAHQGLARSHRVAILEEGVEYQQIGISPEDSQFLETRKFQVAEIARWFRIPPHMLADLDRATFSNIEEMGLEFVIYTLSPWLVRWEQRLSLSLLTPAERKTYFVEHLVNGLLRGDIQKRFQAYATGRQWGWLSADDVRALENMNPLPDGQGQLYMVPLNMIPADQAGEGFGGPVDGSDDAQGAADETNSVRSVSAETPRAAPERRARPRAARARHRLMRSYRRLYKDTLARVLRREKNDILGAANKYLGQRDSGQFAIWLEEFYQEHAEFIRKNVDPLAISYGEAAAAEAQDEVGADVGLTAELERFINAYMAEYAGRHIAKSKTKIQKILERALADGNLDLLEELTRELESWPEARANEIAMTESVRYNNAVAVATYAGAGVERIQSVAFDENCPYCDDLDGRIIGIHQYFLAAGEELKPAGADKPLVSSSNHNHPPYHTGCDCMAISA